MGSAYVIRDRVSGQFAYGRGSHGFTPDIQKARVFSRKTDASNAMPWGLALRGHELETVPVFLSLTPRVHAHPAPTVKHTHPQHAEFILRTNHGNPVRQL